MAGDSKPTGPNKAVSILVNYELRRENRRLHDDMDVLKAADKERKGEIQALKDGLEETLNARLQERKGEMQTLKDGFEETLNAQRQERKGEIQTLKDGLEETLNARLQELTRSFKTADGVLGAEIKEITKRLELDMLSPLQTIAAAFKESEEKRKKGVLLLTEGLGAIIDKHDELVQRVKALEEKCRESLTKVNPKQTRKRTRTLQEAAQESMNTAVKEVAVATTNSDLPMQTDKAAPIPTPQQESRKKQRTSPSTTKESTNIPVNEVVAPTTNNAQPTGSGKAAPRQSRPQKSRRKPRTVPSAAKESATTPANEVASATTTAVPPAQPDPKPTPQQQTATTPGTAKTSVTVTADTPTPPVPAPTIPVFRAGRIQQGALSLQEYIAACTQRVASIRASHQSSEARKKKERDAMVQFVLGMREGRERNRLVLELEKGEWAKIDRGTGGVEFFCGWGVVERVLEGWEKERADDEKGGRK
ncbi:hypothetical protein O988_04759 [Pseudogymnoascus sp. VKM F-3808]|nr:hypothetical protein O988_04759 [Pseudogymnoascus sp. VKM F-3808]